MPQHRRGRIAGTENYSKEDLTALLDESARVLPTGANEWDMVLENYLIYAERTHRAVRGVTSIKKKFQALLNCSKPTGGASCPDYVRRARRIQLAIEESVLHDETLTTGTTAKTATPRRLMDAGRLTMLRRITTRPLQPHQQRAAKTGKYGGDCGHLRVVSDSYIPTGGPKCGFTTPSS
ncbi:hypothetical protein PR003_g22372 [Phytophthora rubi]|uniref:DUF6818 domain-containing protein n=1 Tax=Phytophthora rubi TaxID=129364 RepID=A0A6A4D667_9STRA|nr:hypothetical protein PR002_g21547 [Phytophthora rubi]KAE8989589.1 hypothetical protein PR001_g21739 [Phytophthora rubi]KAE9302067.1 hypothetical protein PR003_g22372 [Phytophthora rubi]